MYFFPYDTMNPFPVKRKIRRRLPPYWQVSLLPEGLAVGALIHSGVRLVGTHQDAVQRAVVGLVAVVSAGLDSALDALVGILVHVRSSFLLCSWIVWADIWISCVAFFREMWYC